MFDFLRRLFGVATQSGPAEPGNSPPDMRPVRSHVYREKLDLTGQPLILLSGGTIESARKLIPFLLAPTELEPTMMPRDEITAYNGEEADEIHVFSNVKQAGAKLSRILVRDGRIMELTIRQ